MTDKHIIFNAPMIRALLAGTKTQTRRKLPSAHPKFPHHNNLRADVLSDPQEVWYWDGIHERVGASYCLPIAPGDRLWVREGCATWGAGAEKPDVPHPVVYAADDPDWEGYKNEAKTLAGTWKVRSPIHMPRWASRLTLTVTDVRVQRVQEISEADAVDEGVDAVSLADVPRQAAWSRRADFAALWNSIHGPDAWDQNPWVYALTFDVHRCNIDHMEGAL